MRDNNELFDFLKLENGGAAAKNINAIDRALAAQFAKMSPSKKTLDNIMAAAEKEKTPAFKKFFALFTYRRMLAAAAAVFILAVIPGLMIKHKSAGDGENLAYASVSDAAGDIENLDKGLDDIISELDYMMEENI